MYLLGFSSILKLFCLKQKWSSIGNKVIEKATLIGNWRCPWPFHCPNPEPYKGSAQTQ